MARINKTQYALLNFINKRPMSGYDAKHFINKLSKLYWTENNAQIYPVLKELELKQLVTSEIDPASGKRQRRIYHITDKGRNYLKAWIESPTELPPYREELLLKIASGHIVKPEVILRQLQDYKAKLEAAYSFYQEIQQHIKDDPRHKAYENYLFMNTRFSELTLKAKITWADECIAKLS